MGRNYSTLRKDRPSEDQRRSPRVETDLTVQVIGPDGDAVQARIVDLARAGVGVSSEHEAGLRILWANQISRDRTVEVRFQLPASGAAAMRTVEARCRVIWSHSEPEGGWRLGLRLIDFWGADAKTLEDFLAACS